MKLAKDTGVKVLLDGQGGDELFAGYYPCYSALFSEMIRNFDVPRLIAESQNLKNAPISMELLMSSLLKLGVSKYLPQGVVRNLMRARSEKRQFLADDLWNRHTSRLGALKERPVTLNHLLSQYFEDHSLKSLLRWEDRNSMHFSIETRTPFADDTPLIDYVFKIPSSYKIINGWSKYLLRQSMAQYLPAETRDRKDKLGFATPERAWLTAGKDQLKGYLTKELQEFVDVEKLLEIWERPKAVKTAYDLTDTAMWRAVNFAVWKKVFKV